jgi:hypothetical protein
VSHVIKSDTSSPQSNVALNSEISEEIITEAGMSRVRNYVAPGSGVVNVMTFRLPRLTLFSEHQQSFFYPIFIKDIYSITDFEEVFPCSNSLFAVRILFGSQVRARFGWISFFLKAPSSWGPQSCLVPSRRGVYMALVRESLTQISVARYTKC